jgi:hypothetical protein
MAEINGHTPNAASSRLKTNMVVSPTGGALRVGWSFLALTSKNLEFLQWIGDFARIDYNFFLEMDFCNGLQSLFSVRL